MSSNNTYKEKEPLLPLVNGGECERIQCQRNTSYKRKYRRQGFLFVLFIILFSIHNNYHEKIWQKIGERRHHHENTNNDVNIANYQSIQGVSDFDDIVAYNDNQMSTYSNPQVSINSYCREKPDIPYTGPSKFEYSASEFPDLTIEQKTSGRNGRSISYNGGDASVFVDSSLSQVTVEFDLKFNNEELQNVVYIEKVENTKKGLYYLAIKTTDENYSAKGCVTIDITVRVPNAADLEALTISLANSGISIRKGLKFEELALAVANGHISFDEGITSAKTGFAVANGHVSGTIDTLSDELHASIANGHIEIVVKEIESSNEAIPLKLSVANGHIDLQVPESFKSTFKLSNYHGRRSVVSPNNSRKIHLQKSGWGTTQGYYGDDTNAKNSIDLSSSSGELKLQYAS